MRQTFVVVKNSVYLQLTKHVFTICVAVFIKHVHAICVGVFIKHVHAICVGVFTKHVHAIYVAVFLMGTRGGSMIFVCVYYILGVTGL